MGSVMRLTLDDWMAGHAECLEQRFLFGEQSDFANSILSQLNTAVETVDESWFNKLSVALTTTSLQSDPTITQHQHDLLKFFAQLNRIQTLFKGDRDPNNQNVEAENLVKDTIRFGSGLFSSSGAHARIDSATSSRTDNSLPYATIARAYSIHYSKTAFWIMLDLLQQAQAPLGQSPETTSTENEPRLLANYQTTTDKSAIVPVLFIDPNKLGYVLWLEVELFSDYPGPFYPDLISFGLTDLVSGEQNLMKSMEEVWSASNLAERYRGRWRITSHYLGTDPDFRRYQQPAIHAPGLGGRSLQAAALAALWAASGEIPIAPVANNGNDPSPKPDVFSLGGESLRLNPRVAISAKLDNPNGAPKDDSMRLGTVEGIQKKLDAICRYCPSGRFEESLFDTVLILSADKTEARKKIPLEVEQHQNYRGVHLIEDCSTMADALLWMLEVNAWKFELNQAVTHDWESQWGYARDVNGVFLNRTSGDPILFSAESAGKDVTEAWKKYFDCPIMVDDDTQKVTLQLKNGQSKAELDQELLANQEALRNRLIEIVKTHGINTGTLDYMANPIGGAEDAGESDPDDVSSENPDSDDSGRDGQSVLGDE
ncbi:MAG: hypothetical protein JNL67_16200 [Planctomycetaceae bacterium]|nr:hypothetical protein [Planctomycetaceae bacterium]